MLRALQAACRLAVRSRLESTVLTSAIVAPSAIRLRQLNTDAAVVASFAPEEYNYDDDDDEEFVYPATTHTRQAWLTRLDGTKIGLINVSDYIFGAPYRQDILYKVVVWQLAKRRAGVAKVKGRRVTACGNHGSEVRGSTRKIAPQKGRGAARHGSIRAPIFVGGGRAHGPHLRSYDYTLPKKIRKLGLRVALSAKFAQGDLSFVDKVAVQTHKTKYLHEMLRQRGLNRACTGLIVGAEELSEDLKRASLNLPYANVLAAKGINVYDCLKYKKVVLSTEAVDYLEELLSSSPSQAAFHAKHTKEQS